MFPTHNTNVQTEEEIMAMALEKAEARERMKAEAQAKEIIKPRLSVVAIGPPALPAMPSLLTAYTNEILTQDTRNVARAHCWVICFGKLVASHGRSWRALRKRRTQLVRANPNLRG